MRDVGFTLIVALLLLEFPGPVMAQESVCFGTVANGRLENGVALPSKGPNFTSFSTAAEIVGRTYVHSTVRDIIADAYKALETTAPNKLFIYGETGWKAGGRFRPHRTHQNGLSVDFMVPVLDQAGRSVPLPGDPLNRYGYGIEFDEEGRYYGLQIDFEAVAEHLYQLDVAARARGISLALVIFDDPYLPRLFATPRGAYLKQNLNFMRRKPWVRHDEHYHLDFAVPCKPWSDLK